MMTGFPKTLPSKWLKVSVKSGLPECSGILKWIERIFSDQADQVPFVPIRDLPNTRRWSG
eukprot:7941677-Karenia_brevis.AAC.1